MNCTVVLNVLTFFTYYFFQTYAVNEQVGDSANTAFAMLSGVVTTYGKLEKLNRIEQN